MLFAPIIWLRKLIFWIPAPAFVALHEFKKHIYICLFPPSPKYFSQLRNVFLPSLFSPKQILSSTKRWRHSSWSFFPLLGNSVSLICPLNSLNKSSTPVQKSLMTSSRARETCAHGKPSLFIPVHTPSCCLFSCSFVAHAATAMRRWGNTASSPKQQRKMYSLLFQLYWF